MVSVVEFFFDGQPGLVSPLPLPTLPLLLTLLWLSPMFSQMRAIKKRSYNDDTVMVKDLLKKCSLMFLVHFGFDLLLLQDSPIRSCCFEGLL